MSKLTYWWLGSVIILSAGLLQAKENASPLKVVEYVDLNRYLGQWYEIARYPNWFQKKCAGGTTATYSIRQDGKIKVVNTCRQSSLDGPEVSKTGKAWVVDKNTNAKLKVQFFWPFAGDYWIIDLGQNYEYVVVGHPGRKYLWILSRTPRIDEQLYNQILKTIEAQGYDPQKLLKTPQGK